MRVAEDRDVGHALPAELIGKSFDVRLPSARCVDVDLARLREGRNDAEESVLEAVAVVLGLLEAGERYDRSLVHYFRFFAKL